MAGIGLIAKLFKHARPQKSKVAFKSAKETPGVTKDGFRKSGYDIDGNAKEGIKAHLGRNKGKYWAGAGLAAGAAYLYSGSGSAAAAGQSGTYA